MSLFAATCPSLSSGRCVMDMSENNKIMTGVIILAAGVIILLGKLGVFSFLGKTLWPLILLIPGIVLHLWHFWRKGPSELLIPGGILVVYSIVFFAGIIGGWSTLKYTWPLFFLGIAVGLFEFYLFSPQSQRGILISSLIVGAVSVLFLSFTLFSLPIVYVLAAMLIIGGVWLIASKGTRGNRRGLW